MMLDLENAVQHLATLKAKMAALDLEKKELEASIKNVVRPGSKIALRNGYTVSVSKESTQSRFNSALFKEKHPDLYDRYSTESKVSPRITITPPKKEK